MLYYKHNQGGQMKIKTFRNGVCLILLLTVSAIISIAGLIKITEVLICVFALMGR